MPIDKPRLFIGSSAEGIKVANAIQENLDRDALCTVWTQGIFEPSSSAVDSLTEACGRSEYAIFVFQADDIVRIRDKESRTARDNVIFEFGLFIGRLGKDRVFFLIPQDVEDLHLPTDLLGMEPGRYEPREDEKDLLASLGAFCNKVRRRIRSRVNAANAKAQGSSSERQRGRNGTETAPEDTGPGDMARDVQRGVSTGESGGHTISIAPTVFFADRVADSFPGLRGLHWFTKPNEAIERLDILLREPLSFQDAVGHRAMRDPIWWFRGHRALEVESFQRLSETRCLLGIQEIEIDKIAVFHSDAYYQSFVYVETQPDEPIGIYEFTQADLERMVRQSGYAYEEFALFDGRPISRTCYDDGAAVIDGSVVRIVGAQLRSRYLSRYNFVIAAKFSPINSPEFEGFLQGILDGVLKGQADVDQLAETVGQLPKSRYDT